MSIIRKSAFDKTEAKAHQTYVDAFNKLNDAGEYVQFVNWHAQMLKFKMHTMGFDKDAGMIRFLSWHRIFLVRFELALRTKESTTYIPYWKWTDGGVPDWMKTFLPTIKGVVSFDDKTPKNVTVERMNISKPFIDQKAIDDIVNNNTRYDSFTTALELGPHNEGHTQLGL